MVLRAIIVATACALWSAFPARAEEPAAIRLTPGGSFTLEFPELPPTLHAMSSGTEAVPCLTVRLPVDYSAEGSFPLFVWLGGGNGGTGAGPGLGPAIMGDRHFIAVGMPLFQESFDPEGPARGLLITTEEDAATIAHAYTTMLRRVQEVIPNIARGHNVLGGFSNGAHSIAAIVDVDDPYLLPLFDHYILAEGGLTLTCGANLAGKDVLVMYGASTEGRHDRVIAALEAVHERLFAGGANASKFAMADTGHALPREFYPEIAAWVRAVTGLSQPPLEEAEPL